MSGVGGRGGADIAALDVADHVQAARLRVFAGHRVRVHAGGAERLVHGDLRLDGGHDIGDRVDDRPVVLEVGDGELRGRAVGGILHLVGDLVGEAGDDLRRHQRLGRIQADDAGVLRGCDGLDKSIHGGSFRLESAENELRGDDGGQRHAGHLPPAERGVARLGMESFRFHGPGTVGVQDHQVHRFGVLHGAQVQRALGGAGAGGVEQAGHVGGRMSHQMHRRGGHQLDEPLLGDDAAVHQHLVADAVGAFQADDAVGRGLQPGVLLLHRMRGVIGGDQVHGAVGDGRVHGLAVDGRAQRRVHLGQRAVLQDRLVGQRDVMRRSLAGDRQALGLGLADRLERTGGADVLEVHVRAGAAGGLDVARHDPQLGVLRDAGQAELAGDRPLVDKAGVVVLAVLD